MRGERQRHLVKTNINIRMVVELLRSLGDPVDESDAYQEVRKLKGAADGLRAVRPSGNGFQVPGDLFGGQGWHDFISDGD